MIYAVLAILAAAMLGGSVAACCKAGERDGICSYGRKDD